MNLFGRVCVSVTVLCAVREGGRVCPRRKEWRHSPETPLTFHFLAPSVFLKNNPGSLMEADQYG